MIIKDVNYENTKTLTPVHIEIIAFIYVRNLSKYQLTYPFNTLSHRTVHRVRLFYWSFDLEL